MSALSKCAGFVLMLCACSVDPAPLQVANPDMQRFANEAYPVLLRDCGFAACHGATDRFFRIYGPGRTRLPAELAFTDPPTAEEIQQSYDRTRSMIDVKRPALSLLLRKPLATKAGGAGHKGDDSLGRNVYLSASDPNFQTLRAWVLGQAPLVPDGGVGP